jgi:6-phospho-beta-glucosidase
MQKKNNRAKIAIIGGGSLYCAELLSQFIENAEELQGCHIILMDINEEDLELIYTISSKLFQHAGVDLILERTTVQEEALDDANFVLTTFRTGGLPARHLDEKIPLTHGLIGQDKKACFGKIMKKPGPKMTSLLLLRRNYLKPGIGEGNVLIR